MGFGMIQIYGKIVAFGSIKYLYINKWDFYTLKIKYMMVMMVIL
jgi:hypothetical protein